MEAMIAADARGYVTAAAVNLVMKAQEEPATMEATLGATLAVPDGQPLVWALHALGHRRATRVYGPDLMARFCARAARKGIPMYLYGGRDAPRARTAHSPPARALLRASGSSAAPRRRFARSRQRRTSARWTTSTPPARRSCGSARASPCRSNGCTACARDCHRHCSWASGRPSTSTRASSPRPRLDAAKRPGVDLSPVARATPAVAALRALQPPLRGRLRAPVRAAQPARASRTAMSRVLLTGGTGAIGAAIVRRLLPIRSTRCACPTSEPRHSGCAKAVRSTRRRSAHAEARRGRRPTAART